MTQQLDRGGKEPTEVATRVTRGELEDLADAYGRMSRRASWLASGGLVAGLGVATLLLSVGARLGWPDVLGPWILAGGWAFGLGSAAAVLRSYRKSLARYDFYCPACDAPVLRPTWRRLLKPALGGRSESSRIQLAVATGRCPNCGAGLVDAEPHDDAR